MTSQKKNAAFIRLANLLVTRHDTSRIRYIIVISDVIQEAIISV
jgi:hypothetical protein